MLSAYFQGHSTKCQYGIALECLECGGWSLSRRQENWGRLFGVIFEGTDLLTHQRVAIKFEPRKSDAPQLRDEYRTYKVLSGIQGVPQVYFFGQEGLHNVLVIDLLGPSLEDLFDLCGRRFSVKTVVMVAKQMVRTQR